MTPTIRKLAIISTAVASATISLTAGAAATGAATQSTLTATPHVWVQTLDEEFNGTTLDTTLWTPQTTAASNFHNANECYVNSPNNISVSNGVLNLTVRKEAAPFVCASPAGGYTTQYTAGSVSTFQKFSQTYGKFEVRAKFPAATVKGLQSSFWLWPVNVMKYGPTWPWSGEIDIAEEYSQYPDRAIPYIHYVPKLWDFHVTSNYLTIRNMLTQFHTYAVIWTSSSISIVYDGVTRLVDNWNPLGLVKPAPFDQPFFIALTQALGLGTNALTSTTPLPATTQVDYVRIWR